MKKLKSAALAVLMFLVSPIMEPAGDRVAPYLLGIVAVALAVLLVTGRAYPTLLGVVLALMLVDKAVTAWIAFQGRKAPAGEPPQ